MGHGEEGLQEKQLIPETESSLSRGTAQFVQFPSILYLDRCMAEDIMM